ncbi:MAG: hypothetical protein JRH18_02810 [Deltaproteobacteria bacterium]|nr:hypothetical protein [Deltaproteobacteria bacterium]MBW1962307.1 hypothetical protein [Deltaproteobacteria bacterium]MBW1996002.1 hypothetical protein [Deltaproteobacteria bacterium]MBW2150579.1 hypothetical protein [Deltaproteobacteria bacterium]
MIRRDDKKRGEQFKLYLLIGFSMILLISGYFRLINKKSNAGAKTTIPLPNKTPTDSSGINMQILDKKIPSDHRNWMKKTSPGHLQTVVRDIFSVPQDLVSKAEKKAEEPPPPPPPMKLKGTIIGGKRPIAIINDRFVHLGDQVAGYRIIRIEKDEVELRSGKQHIVLKVLKHGQG